MTKRRNGCRGSIVYNKLEKKFYKKRDCSDKIKHDTSTFEIFYKEFKNKNLKNYNMNYDKIQKIMLEVYLKIMNV